MCAFFGFFSLSPLPDKAELPDSIPSSASLICQRGIAYSQDLKASYAAHGDRQLLACTEPYATWKWNLEAPSPGREDTPAEKILLRWERSGQLASVMNAMNGPFLVACRDPDAAAIHFLRDPLGQKDLFLAPAKDGVYFSDRLDTLARLPGLNHAHSPQAVADFLSLGYIPAPRTIYENILKVPGGFQATFSRDGKCSLSPYWHPKFAPAPGPHQWLEARKATEELLLHAISRRTEGLDRLGFMLSGGIDSGTLLGMTRRLLPDMPCQAYTVAFSEDAYDESSLAALAAQRQGIPLKVIRATPGDFSRLPSLLAVAGEPFADSSLLACGLCMEAANGETLMTGDGGDELFGGYRRYQAMIHRHRIPRPLDPLARLAARAAVALLPSPKDNRSRLANLVRGLGTFAKRPLEAYAAFQQVASPALRDALLASPQHPSFLESWKEELTQERKLHPPLPYNLLDLLHYLPDDGCRKQTIAAIATNTSLVSPIMDREILDFIQRLPIDFRVTTRETKRLLRSLSQEFLPQQATSLPKRGFGVPISSWFRGPLANTARDMARSLPQWDAKHLLNPQKVLAVTEEHIQGKADHGPLLWALFCLRHWEENTPR